VVDLVCTGLSFCCLFSYCAIFWGLLECGLVAWILGGVVPSRVVGNEPLSRKIKYFSGTIYYIHFTYECLFYYVHIS
jgi:hypothetical protein